jgi:hypothetical protein
LALEPATRIDQKSVNALLIWGFIWTADLFFCFLFFCFRARTKNFSCARPGLRSEFGKVIAK